MPTIDPNFVSAPVKPSAPNVDLSVPTPNVDPADKTAAYQRKISIPNLQPSHNQNVHTLNDHHDKRLQTPDANPAVLGPQENLTPADNWCSDADTFYPHEPRSLDEAGVTKSEVETLIYKYLLARIEASGRGISSQVQLPFQLIEPLLHQAKHDRLVYFYAPAPLNDYVYRLTDAGRERALREAQYCAYFGAAPVTLQAYVESVRRQTLANQQPSIQDLERAFSDLLINKQLLNRLGPAVNSSRGMFLFGPSGNGKTSIAERVTGIFDKYIWIPRAIGVDGEIIQFFDPMNHLEAPLTDQDNPPDQPPLDKRWIRIQRPTMIVGGELAMDHLEVRLNTATGVSEAPLQMKSNCGTLVIDDFGRQKMSTTELLNRWIIPLEKRFDFLHLLAGKKIQVPFDQLIIFSTNLEPKDLVDDTFLRRIPYKIEVPNPTEHEFRELFKRICPRMGFDFNDQVITHLIEKHYKTSGRDFRCCHPRDLLRQIKDNCLFKKCPLSLSRHEIDFAASSYFAVT